MATTIRPEISQSNEYWISKHRYYELKHFCMQYPLWKTMYILLEHGSVQSLDLSGYIPSSETSDPTAKIAMARSYFGSRIRMIENIAAEADESLSNYLVKGITEGWSYDILKARMNIPCCKDVYYNVYRRFFWLLSRERK